LFGVAVFSVSIELLCFIAICNNCFILQWSELGVLLASSKKSYIYKVKIVHLVIVHSIAPLKLWPSHLIFGNFIHRGAVVSCGHGSFVE